MSIQSRFLGVFEQQVLVFVAFLRHDEKLDRTQMKGQIWIRLLENDVIILSNLRADAVYFIG